MRSQLESRLNRFANLTFASQYRCYWGRFGIVKATVSLMRKALEAPFDYAILLSGQDYPIKSNRVIREFLVERDGKEFIESFSILQPNRWGDHAKQRAFGFVIAFRSRVLRTGWHRKFPLGYIPHGGSQWWCLSRPAIEHILQFLRDNPAFTSYFRFTWAPDELIFQNILSNSEFEERICEKITYDDWSTPSPPYPKVLDESDLSVLTTTNCLFARKFDHVTSARLRELLDLVNQ
jgi:hypothetical protein